jgi:hypothetical protein
MNPTEPDTLWRNRFILMNLVRIGATAVALFGFALWQSDMIVEGGNIVGLPVALVGLLASFLAPRWLARRWRQP